MKRSIAAFSGALLLWTVLMIGTRVGSDLELDATSLGIIISVGAIFAFVLALAGHILKITQSKLARFFIFFWSLTVGMVFQGFISNQPLSATIIGVTVFIGVIFGVFVSLVYHIAEKLRG